MERTTISLRAAVAMCAATAVVFLAGVFAVHAWPGRPGVEARSFFTVAGTLTGVPAGGLRSLRLTFHKTGAADCVATAEDVRYDAPNFSAQVPYDAPNCGRGFFDGSDVSFDVAVNDTAIVGPDGGFRVNPVPYAQFASTSGQALSAGGSLNDRISRLEQRLVTRALVVWNPDPANSFMLLPGSSNVRNVENLNLTGVLRVYFSQPYRLQGVPQLSIANCLSCGVRYSNNVAGSIDIEVRRLESSSAGQPFSERSAGRYELSILIEGELSP